MTSGRSDGVCVGSWAVLGTMAVRQSAQAGTPSFRLHEIGIVGVAALLVALQPLLVNTCMLLGIGWWWRMPYILRGVAYATLTFFIVGFGGTTQKFIYFDF